jgi:ribosomal protection tetracycline resistance protein
LAHVDAGKTSLTERILFETGVIAALGRVDRGTTQTDTLALERQRGITIQSAVASFTLDDLTVNLIDTPGHPDFIAEVDRALRVLDAVIVVISAVEGVQPQTHRLVQAVRAAGLPFVIFVNKIDRLGARGLELLPTIDRALGLSLVALTVPDHLGTRDATVTSVEFADQAFAGPLIDKLADGDDSIIARYVELDGHLPSQELRSVLHQAVATGRLVPVCFGSAMTGAGVALLLTELPRMFPAPESCANTPLSAMVFKVQRSPAGEKIALVRIFSGSLAVRDHVVVRRPLASGSWDEDDGRVTGLERFAGGTPTAVSNAGAGDIARVHGLRDVLIGDIVGAVPEQRRQSRFPTPTLESIIRPREAAATGRMYAALRQLEEQDPLISIRRGQREPTVSVRLYGEVQKEVIEATLRDEFDVEVEFAPSQTLCIERVIGTGSASEAIGDAENPFSATLGWPVPDCEVTLTAVGMTPITAAGDFRKLTPLVLMAALSEAGTEVCEPIARFTAEIPTTDIGELYLKLVAAAAVLEETAHLGERSCISGVLPAAMVDQIERLLPDLTGGTGLFRSEPAGHRPVPGPPPSRQRTDFDPLNRKRYLALVSQA